MMTGRRPRCPVPESRRWTRQEDSFLRSLLQAGLPAGESTWPILAQALGRSDFAVRQRARRWRPREG